MNLKTGVLVFAMALLLGCSSGIPISIANQSGQALRNVTITGAGFQQHVSLIPAGATTTLHVEPKGATGVAIAFNLGEKRFAYAEEGYFESGAYEVTIKVDAAGRASVRSDLHGLFTRLVGRW